jgi:hypothetical protein
MGNFPEYHGRAAIFGNQGSHELGAEFNEKPQFIVIPNWVFG